MIAAFLSRDLRLWVVLVCFKAREPGVCVVGERACVSADVCGVGEPAFLYVCASRLRVNWEQVVIDPTPTVPQSTPVWDVETLQVHSLVFPLEIRNSMASTLERRDSIFLIFAVELRHALNRCFFESCRITYLTLIG